MLFSEFSIFEFSIFRHQANWTNPEETNMVNLVKNRVGITYTTTLDALVLRCLLFNCKQNLNTDYYIPNLSAAIRNTTRSVDKGSNSRSSSKLREKSSEKLSEKSSEVSSEVSSEKSSEKSNEKLNEKSTLDDSSDDIINLEGVEKGGKIHKMILNSQLHVDQTNKFKLIFPTFRDVRVDEFQFNEISNQVQSISTRIKPNIVETALPNEPFAGSVNDVLNRNPVNDVLNRNRV